MVTRYIIPAIKEILTHERFKKCGANYERFNGHRLVLYAFIVLYAVTMIVFFCADIIGSGLGIESFHTPWPIWNPVKILGILGGIILIYGSILLIQNRKAREAEGKMTGAYADWFLLYLVLFVGLTGMGALALRVIGWKLAYAMYILHLVCVLILFVGLPFSKFAHLIYRTTVMVFDKYVTDVRARMAAPVPGTTKVEEAPAEEEVEAVEEKQEEAQPA
jgi:quinone-modifying oxidoreductase subunit QmoC